MSTNPTTAPVVAVQRISDFLFANGAELWERDQLSGSIVDACEENARDLGLSASGDTEDAFWTEVLGQLRSELDSFGVVATANGDCTILP